MTQHESPTFGITDELRAMLGVQSAAETRPPVTAEQIARYAYAADDVNPLYLDEDAAKNGPHGGVVAPPLFVGVPSFKPTSLSQLRDDGLPSSEGDPLRPPIPSSRTRLVGSDFTFLRRVRPGDILTRQSHLADIYEKEGRSGKMLFTVRETRYTDQSGATVCIDRVTTTAIQESAGDSRPAPAFDVSLTPDVPSQSLGPPPSDASPVWDEVNEGDVLPETTRLITPVQVFLYGAVKGNSHLIHYDRAYAQREGLPERVTQGDLLGDFLCQVATRWMGSDATLRAFKHENRGPGFVGEEIIHHGRVKRRWTEEDSPGVGLVELELWSEGNQGRICLRGSATVALPK